MKGLGSQHKTHMKQTVSKYRGDILLWRSTKGYTIVEVMIFLAVTTALFVMIAGTFSSQQKRTEFSTSAREMESRVRDIANDVSTGRYDSNNSFGCTVSVGVPVFSSGSPKNQGTNQDCIFIGKVIHFGVDGSGGKSFNIYPVAGARQFDDPATGKREVVDLIEANPRAIAGTPPAPDLTETIRVPSGIVLKSVKVNGAPPVDASAVGFFTTFGTTGSNTTTSLSVDVVPLGVGFTKSKDNIISAINDAGTILNKNPSDGIEICMDSEVSNQHATLTIGGKNSRLTTDLAIEDGKCT